MALSASQQKLRDLCYAHAPILKPHWDDVFREDHPHAIAPSTTTPGSIKYHTNGKAITTTLGKYLLRQRKQALSSQMERGLALVSAGLRPQLEKGKFDDEFQILRGREIMDAYLNNVGGSSCMCGAGHQNLVQFYADFPERIGLLVWQKTKARTLCWTDDKGRYVLDRLYAGGSSEALARYMEWVKANGALWPAQVGGGGVITITLGPLAVEDGRYTPHLDSFYYASEDGVFSNNAAAVKAVWSGHNTTGHLQWCGPTCHCCKGTKIKKLITPYKKFPKVNVCEPCSKKFIMCTHGVFVEPKDATIYGENVYCKYCVTNYLFQCPTCKKWVEKADFLSWQNACRECAGKLDKCSQCGQGGKNLDGKKLCPGCREYAVKIGVRFDLEEANEVEV